MSTGTRAEMCLWCRNVSRRESFPTWVERVDHALEDDHGIVYQMPFIHDGIRGVADFLERVEFNDGGYTYEPVDAKLARTEAKPGHVLQLCFYAEALEARTGRMPENLHLALGSGRRETIRIADVTAYWRRLRGQLARVVGDPPSVATAPEKCEHCAFCEFELVCDAEWRAEDSLIHVAGIRTVDRRTLEADGVDTIAGLAALDRDVAELDPVRLERFVRQAALQVRARDTPDGDPPPFELLDDGADEESDDTELTGFAALPEPAKGDVFLDFEGHPFWRPDNGLFFLFGLIARDLQGDWRFESFWAHDPAGEATATGALITYLADRRRRFPDMHVYHYNHTERTSLVRLSIEHGVAELELERLIATGLFVDLFPIVKGAIQVGVESYGLKHIELLTDYVRSHDIDKGTGAIVEYEGFMQDSDPSRLDRIARYNEDDVRATLAIRDWLVDHRPDGFEWRNAVLEPAPSDEELDERIEALHAFDPGTPEHLLGDLLGYWRREKRVVAADALRLSIADDEDQVESLSAIARLSFVGFEDQFSGKTGKKLKWPAAVFSFPNQPLDADISQGSRLIVALSEQEWASFDAVAVDRHAGELRLGWTDTHEERGVYPTSLAHYEWFPEGAKLTALRKLADELLAGGADLVGHSMLRNEPSRFIPGGGPTDGTFTSDLESIRAWAPQLDRTFVPIQGPPGTGKTFTGAHIVRTLVNEGSRVGITAMSHQAIDNLMQAVVNRFAEGGETLRAVRKAKRGSVNGVQYIDDNSKCATGDFDVVAGTAWLFASKAMRDNPVDVLVIDEAGQLGLADTLAASVSATNVILLGDPQQLPQVSQANHPSGSGASALEHFLGQGIPTFTADRGVLLNVTWRMHPDVCEFISNVMYEGRLTSDVTCVGQSTAEGTGLRWTRAEHTGNSTEAPEEAHLVASTIKGLLGTDWTDQHGVTRPLAVSDMIVVTPYNDQRRLITTTIESDPATAGVEVGTVDKFQGREAAVVLFSMATSSSEFMPRTAEFLFSRNRLNVAISRARCLAYLICTDDLLNTRARSVEEMTLISALCSFVERCESTDMGEDS